MGGAYKHNNKSICPFLSDSNPNSSTYKTEVGGQVRMSFHINLYGSEIHAIWCYYIPTGGGFYEVYYYSRQLSGMFYKHLQGRATNVIQR